MRSNRRSSARRSAIRARSLPTRAARRDRRSSFSRPTAASGASRRRPALRISCSTCRPTPSSRRSGTGAILRTRRSNTTVSPAAGSSLRRPMRSPAGSSSRRATRRRSPRRRSGASSRSTTTDFPGAATCAVDSPTFGLDPYALYIGVLQFCDPGGVYMGTSGFVVRKTSVIDFATIAVTAFHNLTGSSTGCRPVRAARRGHRRPEPRDRVLYRRRQRLARAR